MTKTTNNQNQDINKIKKTVLEKIKPTKDYSKTVDTYLDTLNTTLKDKKISAELFVGGSFAKGTYLAENFDCDIFVRFKNPTSNFSKHLEDAIKIVAQKLNSEYEKVKGSRDYFQVFYKGMTFETVPVKFIEKIDDAENIMDFSPFHVNWVKKEIEKKQLADDIRVMKQFLKANKLYGAESYIKGISGHVNDIIVLFYEGFNKALEHIAKWKKDEKTIIDYTKAYKGQDVTFFMNQSKTQSPLIVVDPIEKDRNASAATSQEQYEKLIDLAKEFLKNPNESYFTKKETTKESFQKENKNKEIIVIHITPTKGKKDITGAKLLKSLEYIEKELKKVGFIITNTDWEWNQKDNATFFLATKEANIPKAFFQKGPKNDMPQAIKQFKEAYKNAEFKEVDNHLCVKKERKQTNILEAIKHITKDEYIQSRIKKIDF